MQKIKNISIYVVCLLIMIVASLLFVGCGGNDNKIRLNEVTHSIFYAPLYAAYNLGFFEDEGLEVTIESATGSDASMTALLSGSADIVLVGPETVVYSQGTQDSPVIFGQLTQKDGSFFVSRDNITDFTLDDLKGTTIIGGRQGGMPAMTLEYIIEQAGLTIGTDTASGQVNLRTDVSFPMIGSEFVTSGCEFCTLFEPTATNLQKEGNGYVLDAVGEFSGYLPYTVFATKQSFLDDKSEQAEKFLQAVYNGYTYIATHTSLEAAQALAPSFSGMTTEELQIAVEQYLAIDAWCSSPVMTEASYTKMMEIINSTSDTQYTVNYSQIVDLSLIHISEPTRH
mgnify:CR=1 FL=1